MPKHILYLSYDGLTDPLGQSQILPYLISLTQYNYQFTIISFEKKENFPNGKTKIQSLIKDYPIHWLPLTYHKKPPIFSTLYDIWVMTKIARQVIKKSQIKIMHCRSYITSIVGLQMKRKYGVKFIFDMRGFWADERVEGGLWNLSNPLYRIVYRFFKNKELKFLEESDHVVTLTEKSKKIMLSEIDQPFKNFEPLKGYINPNKITVIPTCVDLEMFKPEGNVPPEIETIKEIVKNKLVISYLGSIGTWYMLDEMLLFFKALLKKKSDAVLFFITTHSKKEIYNKANELGVPIENLLIKSASRNVVPHYLSLSHYNIFFIRPTFSKAASAATKMGEALAMGIPVITNSGWGDVEEIINKENCGILVDEFKESAYQDAIRAIHDTTMTKQHLQYIQHLQGFESLEGLNARNLEGVDYNNLKGISSKCRVVAEKYFSLEMGVIKYRQIYEKLL